MFVNRSFTSFIVDSFLIRVSPSVQIYVITDPFPDKEYLIIEMRFGMKWDEDFTGHGIVIYHVDNLAGDDNLIQSTRGFPGHSNWPAEHYRVAVLQADGRYDIEQLINNGDETDFWTDGTSVSAVDIDDALSSAVATQQITHTCLDSILIARSWS